MCCQAAPNTWNARRYRATRSMCLACFADALKRILSLSCSSSRGWNGGGTAERAHTNRPRTFARHCRCPFRRTPTRPAHADARAAWSSHYDPTFSRANTQLWRGIDTPRGQNFGMITQNPANSIPVHYEGGGRNCSGKVTLCGPCCAPSNNGDERSGRTEA